MNKLKEINITYILILSTVSFIWFLTKNHTAYEWPAIDMMPFYERYFDKNFLINDFFTNSITSGANPRWIFGYLIIYLTKIFHTEWYNIYYFLKVFLVLSMPILYYLVIYLSTLKFIAQKSLTIVQLIIFLAILIILYPRFAGVFSIAWWSPYDIQVIPQTISLFFGFIWIILNEICDKKYKLIISIFLAIATFIHPIIGLFLIIFYNIIDYKNTNIKEKIFIFIFGSFIPLIIDKIFLGAKYPINTSDFINIYILMRHPSHYHLAEFGTLTPVSWIYSFILMFTLLIIPLIYAYIKKNKSLFILSILFISSYLISIGCQYLFIDILPLKFIAMIGPVRFTQFTYWMIVISWSIMLSNIVFMYKLKLKLDFRINIKLMFVIYLVYIIYAMLHIDNPKDKILLKDKMTYNFIQSTPQNSIFISYPSAYKRDIPNIANRAIFIGNGFVFNENKFKEYRDRYELIYGADGNDAKSFFRKLTPKDFITISKSYKVNYILIESKYSNAFNKYNPVYKNTKIKIYKINDFKEK